MSAETTEPENLTVEENQPLEEAPAPLTLPTSPPVAEVHADPFELKDAETFSDLEAGRRKVHSNVRARDSFRDGVGRLGESGEEGRLRGLGLWVLGRYRECVEALASYSSDDTALYTRARALFTLQRFGEAAEIFEQLAKKYPGHPQPLAASLEAKLEVDLRTDTADEEALGIELDARVSEDAEFAASPHGSYLKARACELRRDWEEALDLYSAGHEDDPDMHNLTRRFAHLAERNGLDELALVLYEHLIENGQADRTVLMNLGVLYEDIGRDSDAAACYDTVFRNDPTDETARLYLSDARAAIHSYYDEDLEKKEDRLNQILRIPITDFELSVRARNCLNKMQINTLGDLVQKTEQELLSYKNFGETSLTEIKEILHSKGLRLGMPREEAVVSIEAHAQRSTTGDRSDLLNRPILELQLSIRARRTVETLGCLTLGDVTKHSAEELLGMPNFGQTSLQELRSKLGEVGLKLKGD